jgi:hypothetical protein
MAALTKPQLVVIRADINAALAAVAKKHGVDFSLGNIRFSPDTLTGKLTGVVRSAAGNTTGGPVDLKSLALAKSGTWLLGNTFVNAAKYRSPTLGTVNFVGYNSRARAYPFIVLTSSGKRYKISSASAKSIVAAGVV